MARKYKLRVTRPDFYTSSLLGIPKNAEVWAEEFKPALVTEQCFLIDSSHLPLPQVGFVFIKASEVDIIETREDDE